MKDILKPVIVLASICLVVTAMLAYVNSLTKPIIIKAEKEAAAAARTEVLHEAKDFGSLDTDGLPEGVTEAYRGSGGTGYVFIIETKGYGGTIKFICGIKSDGTLEAIKTLSHTETSGVGTKVVDNNSGYRDKFAGKNDVECRKTDVVTGATVSSNAFKKAVETAFKAYNIVREAKA